MINFDQNSRQRDIDKNVFVGVLNWNELRLTEASTGLKLAIWPQTPAEVAAEIVDLGFQNLIVPDSMLQATNWMDWDNSAFDEIRLQEVSYDGTHAISHYHNPPLIVAISESTHNVFPSLAKIRNQPLSSDTMVAINQVASITGLCCLMWGESAWLIAVRNDVCEFFHANKHRFHWLHAAKFINGELTWEGQ